MPLTNNIEDAKEAARHHVWLRDGEEIVAGNTEALCGEVHANPGTDLVKLVELEWSGDEATLPEWLDREDVCAECGDLARESMGLDPRPLEDVSGVGTHKAEALRSGGFRDVADLRDATQHELSELPEIGNALAARIKADVGGYDQ